MVLGSKTMVLEPVFGPKTGVRNRGFGTMFWGVPGPLFWGSRRDPKTGSKKPPSGGWFSGPKNMVFGHRFGTPKRVSKNHGLDDPK